MSGTSTGVTVLLVIGALLILILVPLSFSYVEYYQYGFEQNRATGSINTDKVYEEGRHHLGPNYKFFTYSSIVHDVTFNDLAVFTADRSEMLLDCSFQYFLQPAKLANLHRAFKDNYQEKVESAANAALKNYATQFSVNQYLNNRSTIEAGFHSALRASLSGECDETIRQSNFQAECDGQGIYVEPRYFQLLAVEFFGSITTKLREQVILAERNEAAVLNNRATDIREQTKVLVQQKKDLINEIGKEAEARSTLIRERAKANAQAIVDQARFQGLSAVYDGLGITEPKHKAALDYIRTLLNHQGISLNVNFGTLVAGPAALN